MRSPDALERCPSGSPAAESTGGTIGHVALRQLAASMVEGDAATSKLLR